MEEDIKEEFKRLKNRIVALECYLQEKEEKYKEGMTVKEWRKFAND
jgi:hypothetical protein